MKRAVLDALGPEMGRGNVETLHLRAISTSAPGAVGRDPNLFRAKSLKSLGFTDLLVMVMVMLFWNFILPYFTQHSISVFHRSLLLEPHGWTRNCNCMRNPIPFAQGDVNNKGTLSWSELIKASANVKAGFRAFGEQIGSRSVDSTVLLGIAHNRKTLNS